MKPKKRQVDSLEEQLRKKLDLPKPKHELGYTFEELDMFMTEGELKDFGNWIYGQTMAMEEGKPLVYVYDVARYLNLVRHNVSTLFD
jgi:hypothetical protein